MIRKLCLYALLAACLQAQTYTGSIRGRAKDPAGAAVPSANVTVTEINTNAVRKTATNESGDYIVSFLKPGDYRISVAAQGFKESVQNAVRLQLNQSMT